MIEHHTSRPTVRTVTELEGPLSALLENDRRKRTLSALLSAGGERSFDELTADVATSEGPCFATPDERTRDVAVTLHHSHLPKLADNDLIDYDAEHDHVALTSAGTDCAEMLDL